LQKIILSFLVIVMFCVSTLLMSEYLFFKKQSKKILELQNDYRTYVLAVNKILRDYNKIKEEIDSSSNLLDEDKKKKEFDEINQDEHFARTFPDGIRVFSSDDIQENSDCFLVVNRELDYLHKGTIEYLKMSKKVVNVKSTDFSDWCEYTEYILAIDYAKDKLKKSQKNRLKRVVKSRSPKRKPKSKQVYSHMVNTDESDSQLIYQNQQREIILAWPIQKSSFWISSFFGPRKKRRGVWGFHYGVDMAAMKGTEVRAAQTGIVVEARYAKGYGNTIVIAHTQKYRTRYAHLSRILVQVGQKVLRGKLIAKVGDTGYVSSSGRDASHLHFELLEYGRKVNPMRFMY